MSWYNILNKTHHKLQMSETLTDNDRLFKIYPQLTTLSL